MSAQAGEAAAERHIHKQNGVLPELLRGVHMRPGRGSEAAKRAAQVQRTLCRATRASAQTLRREGARLQRDSVRLQRAAPRARPTAPALPAPLKRCIYLCNVVSSTPIDTMECSTVHIINRRIILSCRVLQEPGRWQS